MPELPSSEQITLDDPVEDLVQTETGKWFIRRVLPYQSATNRTDGVVLTFGDVTELQRREHEIRDREQQLRCIADAIPPLVAFVDLEQRYRFVNAAYGEHFGREPNDIIAHTVRNVIGEANYQAVQPHLERALRGEHVSFDASLHGAGPDSVGHKEVTYIPQRSCDGSVEGVHVLVTDLTDRIRTELSLREGQRKLDLALSAGHLGAWEWEIGTDLVSWSESLYETLAYDHDQFPGSLDSFVDLVHPDDRDESLQRIRSALAGESENYEVEVRMRRGDGQYIWVFAQAIVLRDDEGKPQVMTGVASDISGRKRRELDLAFHASLQAEFNLISDAAELMRVSVERVSQHLQLTRCVLAEMDQSAEVSTVIFDHRGDATQASIIGQHRISDFFLPEERDVLVRGQQVVIDDIHDSGRDAEIQANFAAMQIRSLCNSAYVTGKGLKFVVAAVKSEPHVWQSYECELLQDVCNRLCLRLERARSEAELIDREAHLRRVINNQLGLVGVIDADGILREVDDRSLRIAGLLREEVIGSPFASAPWWSYDQALSTQMHEAVDRAMAGEVVRFDVGMLSINGDPLMIDFMLAPVSNDDGIVEYLIPSGVDISDRFEAEKVIREANAKLRVLFDQSYFYTGILNTGGILTDINDAALTPFGFTREQTLGLPFWETPWWDGQPESQRKLREKFPDVLRGNVFREQLAFSDPNGNVRYSDFVYTPAVDESGTVLFVVANGSDVTERHDYEASLQKARKIAEKANEAKSEFIANMSHEIRTPMTAILGYADLALKQTDNLELRELLETINRNGHFLLAIINDILDLSKIEAGKMETSHEPFSIIDLIEDVRSIMSVRAERKGSL